MTNSTKLEPEVGMNGDEISLLDLFVVLAENIKLLIVGPLVVGALAFAISYALPKTYTSEAYLRLPKGEAEAAKAFILSPAVLDKAAALHPPPGEIPSDRKRERLSDKIEWSSGDAGLAILSVSDSQPSRAQATNSALIEGWIEQTKPGPDQTERIEQQIELNERQLNSVTALIDRLAKETPQLVIPGMQNELATSLASLQADRNRLVAEKDDLQRRLAGVSRDVILVPPMLPTEPIFPRKGRIAVYSALASGILLLGFVLLIAAFRFSAADPNSAAKIERIRNSLLFRRKTS